MWDEDVIPQQLKYASIVRLYKKGNRQLCGNYRGISLLAIAGNILAQVLLNRLIVHLEQGLLPESQCGFRGGRGTVDMIFAARQLQEKCQEQYDDLFFITFIDLTKAFDTDFGFISSHKRSETALHDASHDNHDGIQLKYRTYGGVFNLRRLKANTKVKVATLRELLFADVCTLNSNTGT